VISPPASRIGAPLTSIHLRTPSGVSQTSSRPRMTAPSVLLGTGHVVAMDIAGLGPD
jgi:hypothetical protein